MGGKRTLREKAIIEGLSNSQVLEQLEGLAGHLNISVRYEKGDFSNGYCLVDDTEILFLKQTEPEFRKIDFLMKELSKYDFEAFQLHPDLSAKMIQLKDELINNQNPDKERL